MFSMKLRRARDHQQSKQESATFHRLRRRSQVVNLFTTGLLLTIVLRLGYWQVIHRSVLQAEAESQYERVTLHSAARGKIHFSDGALLVGNTTAYRLFAQPRELTQSPEQVAQILAPILAEAEQREFVSSVSAARTATMAAKTTPGATESAVVTPPEDLPSLPELQTRWQTLLQNKLRRSELKWVALKQKLDEVAHTKIAALNIKGIGFDQYLIRDYPEASMAAHVIGFVGKGEDGEDKGYFGVEGALDRELRGQEKTQKQWKDALGFRLFGAPDTPEAATEGRSVILTLRRDVQHLLEEELRAGVAKYQASEGEVVVMEPSTGKILGMAAWPSYDPAHFYAYPAELYKNPLLADVYEPGSTFKVLTIATGIDTGAVKPDTICDNCERARQIGKYSIKTWNGEYHPNITMTDALAKSDNVAMIFAAERIGKEKFIEYIKKFGIGEEIHLDLQEDTSTPFRQKWGDVDLATSSFGQGISTTAMQMVRAVGAIANHGRMMRPQIVKTIVDASQGKQVIIEPIVERDVISPATAATLATMMIDAAQHGEAQWISSKDHLVSGKTGTAQVAIAGHYDEKKTVASFVGFAPPTNPKFVMIVKLREPQSSPWAAETAAPLWYSIANKLYLLLNIPPDRGEGYNR